MLEIGSGPGDLLAALRPASGIGVDFDDLPPPEDTDAPPPGKHSVSNSGETNALPKTIAERFHEQYPAYKDLK